MRTRLGIVLFMIGCGSAVRGLATPERYVGEHVSNWGLHVSAVIPLREVRIGSSGVVMSMPLALAEIDVEPAVRQRVRVRWPLNFETEVPTNDLPWVVRGPVHDASGVFALGSHSIEVVAVHWDRYAPVVDLDPGEGLTVRDIRVPLVSLALQAREATTYFWDDMALLLLGRDGHERLALRYLGRPDPEAPTSVPNAMVRGTRFRLRSAPEPDADSLVLEVEPPRNRFDVEVIESGPLFSRVRIAGDRHALAGWVSDSILFTLDSGSVGGIGISSAEGDLCPFVSPEDSAAADETGESEPLWQGLASIRSGAPVYATPNGPPIASFEFDRSVTVRAARTSDWVEIVEFTRAFDRMEVLAGTLLVRRCDVALNAVTAYGLTMQGSDPSIGSPSDRFVVREIDAAGFWSPTFAVGDELVRVTVGATFTLGYAGTDAFGAQVFLEGLAADLFAVWTYGAREPRADRRIVVQRNAAEVSVRVPEPRRSLLLCEDGIRSCADGMIEHLQAECEWQRGAWRCDPRAETRAAADFARDHG